MVARQIDDLFNIAFIQFCDDVLCKKSFHFRFCFANCLSNEAFFNIKLVGKVLQVETFLE